MRILYKHDFSAGNEEVIENCNLTDSTYMWAGHAISKRKNTSNVLNLQITKMCRCEGLSDLGKKKTHNATQKGIQLTHLAQGGGATAEWAEAWQILDDETNEKANRVWICDNDQWEVWRYRKETKRENERCMGGILNNRVKQSRIYY